MLLWLGSGKSGQDAKRTIIDIAFTSHEDTLIFWSFLLILRLETSPDMTAKESFRDEIGTRPLKQLVKHEIFITRSFNTDAK